MGVKALSYMDSVILALIRNYRLPEEDATRAVKSSYLYESLIENPTDTMHDSINTSADNVYAEIYGEN